MQEAIQTEEQGDFMEHPFPEQLADISTMWTVLEQATGQAEGDIAAAQQLILKRYRPAIYAYLRSAVHDESAAADLTQEFSLALVRGDFRKIDRSKGRFRGYVKSVLFHMVSKYRKEQQRLPQPLAPDSPQFERATDFSGQLDIEFDEAWRGQLLSRAWNSLEQAQPVYFLVLQYAATNRQASSKEMAPILSKQTGRKMTPESIRQTLRRARLLFAELLVHDVACSLKEPDLETLTSEIADLRLLKDCQEALDKLATQRNLNS